MSRLPYTTERAAQRRGTAARYARFNEEGAALAPTSGLLVVTLVTVICLAYANGANDNFKGVATLFGSGTSSYRALAWATITTLLGSLTAVFLAKKLLKSFSGAGLVASELASSADYGAAVALGAGLTVLVAIRFGMPVSTTHSLVGALIGAGWAANSVINLGNLASGFVTPLLVSPLLAVGVTMVLYPIFSTIRQRQGITSEACLCVGNETVEVLPTSCSTVALQRATQLSVQIGDLVTCRSRDRGKVRGIDAATVLDPLHFLPAGMVSFARGLNDTPKIAALLLLGSTLGGLQSSALVGLSIAIGGIASARRVADTMSQRITEMNHGQGFTANLVTSSIVIAASRFGLPVSTTHVSCGSLFGLGVISRQAHWGTIGRIVGAWVVTLPMGAALGAICFWLMAPL